ncbi:hypothetical protein H0H92_012413 [Tricholoma furcatifolium]|nr:hypothetical protein H0H92_012413 [Tricholoma furcatifolium]
MSYGYNSYGPPYGGQQPGGFVQQGGPPPGADPQFVQKSTSLDCEDTDRSGTIGFREDWQNVFRHFDRDNSGSIDRNELQAALAQFQLIHVVDAKGKDASVSGPGARMGGMPMPGTASASISFDRFLRACVVVKQISETFGRFDTNRSGWIQINYDQFMDAVLRLP